MQRRKSGTKEGDLDPSVMHPMRAPPPFFIETSASLHLLSYLFRTSGSSGRQVAHTAVSGLSSATSSRRSDR